MSFLFGSRSKHLPPGPPGVPIIGNLKQIPSNEQWVWFHNISKKYGDVNTLHVLNTTLIVLNSQEAIDTLFNKKADQYSNKPSRWMANSSNLIWTAPFMPQGPDYEYVRKMFHDEIGQQVVGKYNKDYETSSRRFMQTLMQNLHSPDLTQVIDDSIGHVFLKVSTGYEPKPTDTILTQLNDLAHFAADVLADKFQVFDLLPPLRWLPTWTPVIGPMLELGAKWKKQLNATADETVKLAQEGKDAGNDSVMYDITLGKTSLDMRTKMIGATMNAGGMLATESATLTFLLAMAKFPEIQRRAQAEVDGLTEGKRLPTMADRPNLPFVDAVLSEVLRWVSIAPVITREATKDDVYNGHLIPKGATLMANNWAISRDEKLFPDPEAFKPERWLDASGTKLRDDLLDPMQFAFGFGHHTCPGRYLADALLFSHYAHILAVFDVALPPVAEKAQLDADAKMKVKSNGAACRVEEVYVQLAPRSAAATELINQATTSVPAPAPTAETASASANGPASPVPNGAPSAKSNAAH
ncbi:hypothetical protein VTO73DRAFT_4505 [Trametes versicolor]